MMIRLSLNSERAPFELALYLSVPDSTRTAQARGSGRGKREALGVSSGETGRNKDKPTRVQDGYGWDNRAGSRAKLG
eukprot:1958330-Pyramimonas_sp.AAC.1